MKTKRTPAGLLVILFIGLIYFFLPRQTNSANLTVAKNTLQSSRMSFYGRVKSPTIAGSSHVWIYTAVSGNATSISTDGLKPGDTLQIGAGTSYVIGSIIDDDEFTITTTLASGDADDTDVIYYKAKPQHVVTFQTASAVNGGFFQVLIPAASSNFNDTIPDISGFDFNTDVTATATTIAGEYVFDTPVATVAGGTGCTSPANYHCFEFHYTGTGSVGTDITLKVGETGGADTLIAPAPSSTRVANTADSYTFLVKNFTNTSNPNSATPTDNVTGKIAVIESVRVSATVDPSITFKIEGVATSTNLTASCGFTTSVTTTNASVPFGIMALDTFKQAAQKLTVSTNATGGYTVTAIENEQLSNLASTPVYIPDTLCDTGACSDTASGAWTTEADHPGLGYSVAEIANNPQIEPIAPLYQHFPSLLDVEDPFPFMWDTDVSSSQQAYVCYKLSVDATQAAGDYENQITYTATATF